MKRNIRITRTKVRAKTKYAPWLILCILLDILAVALIPLNMLYMSLPEWITVIFAALVLFSSVLLWIKGTRHKVINVFISLLCLLAMCFTLFGAYCNPYWNNLFFRTNADAYSRPYNETVSGKEAKQDLDYAVKYLQKCHPALIHGLPSDISEKVQKTSEELLQLDTITVNALSVKIQQIFSMLSDGHTYAADNCPDRHYLKETHSHNEAGDTLTKVNGKTIGELFKEKSDLYSFEAESYGLVRMKDDLGTLEGLDYLGISVSQGVVFVYETTDGEEKEFTYFEEDFVLYDEYLRYNNMEGSDSEQKSFVYYEVQKERNLAVLTLDSCIYNDEYIKCLKEMFTEVKAQGIENVCVDLRSNGGGTSLVANEFIKYLDVPSYKDMGMVWRLGCFEIGFEGAETENPRYTDLLFNGNVYMLTSYYTFSSAMDFTQYITDNGLGTVIGEPCGNSPNGYGEITLFKCPNSQIAFQISTKKWTRIDKENTDLLLQPDIECEADKALDRLYEIIA